ncbi:non-ribosomal peptide synthase protein (TIGR01720 family) [Branchiibius hedensis]|uniref:Non-ribosomal peptide synthase domain TIGR01720 n=1 Tax=Branchiibius hedensis TaxID=672460 RepID=A0A2Y9BMT1_9MICO|nr:condensation domain-containing protein [Branchiibius hedensis]PWJ23324.1 non-ribosomal peptide synthase protein (TIGR01720 family) [Branchiibius hedensis]SSA59013.1 non-ribosomal peptide synthase domain TIGR01720 [Branchiibius hedensis]
MSDGVIATAKGFPLSFAQRRLHFIQELGVGAYSFPVHVRLEGELDEGALLHALDDVGRRHPILTATITQGDSGPVLLHRDRTFPVAVVDLTRVDVGERRRIAAGIATRQGDERFDFAECLVRATLVRAVDEHLLLLDFHHIVFDGWSFGIFADELAAAYDRHLGVGGVGPDSPAPQYHEHALREQSSAEHGDFLAEKRFWVGHLAGADPLLSLPTDRPRPEVLSGRTGRQRLRLPVDLSASLRAQASAARATPYMFLLAAFQLLAGRLSGQQSFCIGGGTSGRQDPATHEMIGHFVNEVVFRSCYRSGIGFDELLEDVRRSALTTYRHDQIPFELVVDAVAPPRSLSAHPVFQHALTLQPDNGAVGVRLRGVQVSDLDFGGESSALDLSLSVHEEAGEFVVVMDYSSDLWDAESAASLLEDFGSVLTACSSDPTVAVESIVLRSPVRDYASAGVGGLPAPAHPVRTVATSTDAILAEIWRGVLRLDSVGLDENFFDLGGDSLLGLRVVAGAKAAGLCLRPRDIFLAQTVRELSQRAEAAPVPSGPVVASAGTSVGGDVPLLPIQLWLLEMEQLRQGHYNFASLYDVDIRLDPAVVVQAIGAAADHHDALRTRIALGEDGTWSQRPPNATTASLAPLVRAVDLRDRDVDPARALDRLVRLTQADVALDKDRLFAACSVLLPDGSHKVLLAAHHLVMDPLSMRVLAEDVAMAAQQLSEELPVQLLPVSTRYASWARALRAMTLEGAFDDELPYWRNVVDTATGHLMVTHADGVNDVASQQTTSRYLGQDEVTRLRVNLRRRGYSLTETVLAAAGAALVDMVIGGEVLVDFETHGREDIVPGADVSRTVGWFSAQFPVIAPCHSMLDPAERLTLAQARLDSVPRNGIGYGHLAFGAHRLRAHSSSVGVTYLGRTSTEATTGVGRPPLVLVDSPGHDRSPEMPRPHELEIGAIIVDDVLEFAITWSSHRFSPQEVDHMLDRMDDLFGSLLATTDIPVLGRQQ